MPQPEKDLKEILQKSNGQVPTEKLKLLNLLLRARVNAARRVKEKRLCRRIWQKTNIIS